MVMRRHVIRPVDPEAMGRLWARVGLDPDVAERRARYGLSAGDGRRALRAYRDATRDEVAEATGA